MDYYDRHRYRHRRRYDDDEMLSGRRYVPETNRHRRRSNSKNRLRRPIHSQDKVASRKKSLSSASSDSDEDKKGMIEFKKGEKINDRCWCTFDFLRPLLSLCWFVDEIVRVAGQGTFGTVLECLDHKHGMRRVAVKAVRSVERYLDAASIEIEILQTIADKDVHGNSLCVRLLTWFSARHRRREHMFLVFEYLGRDLYTFMKRNGHRGFSLEQVKSFAYQLLKAVQFCHSVKLCHTDLKVNVLELWCFSLFTITPHLSPKTSCCAPATMISAQ